MSLENEDMETIKDEATFNKAMNNDGGLVVIHFLADWATQCSQITDVLSELKRELAESRTTFLQVG